jgi:hypothetical protein
MKCQSIIGSKPGPTLPTGKFMNLNQPLGALIINAFELLPG